MLAAIILAAPLFGAHHFTPAPGSTGFHDFAHAEMGLEYAGAKVRINCYPMAGWSTVGLYATPSYPQPWWWAWGGLRLERLAQDAFTIVGEPTISVRNLSVTHRFDLHLLVERPHPSMPGEMERQWAVQGEYVLTVFFQGYGIRYADENHAGADGGCNAAPGGACTWGSSLLALLIRRRRGSRALSH